MRVIADVVGSNPVLYVALSVISHVLMSLICVLAVPAIFKVRLRRNVFLWAACAVLCAAVGALRPFWQGENADLLRIWETLALLQPYVCALLLVPLKHVWKGFAASLGYIVIEAPKYLLMLLFFDYDGENIDFEKEFIVEFILHVLFFLLMLFLYASREKERRFFAMLLLLDPVFYVLIVVTVIIFMFSLMMFGSSFSEEDQGRLAFLLMNIPAFAATLGYGVRNTIKARNAEENYKRELDLQIKHYEAMEKMNEDLRIFRHDLPKKLRPMVAYLDENNPEAAKEIAEELGAFASGGGTRYRTGNYRLDTVLFCEQQTAAKDGIKIVFTYDSCFPAEGIAPDDIYTIFPNALDNAIEACRAVEGEKEITVTSKIAGDMVFVTVSNPFAGTVRMKDGVPQTAKKDKSVHGYGIRSIKKAAANYGSSNVDFVTEDGRFTLRVYLKYKSASEKT